MSIFSLQVSVRSELEKSCVLRVSGLKSGGSLLDKAVIRCIMDGCPRPRPIDPKSEVILFREVSEVRLGAFCDLRILPKKAVFLDTVKCAR